MTHRLGETIGASRHPKINHNVKNLHRSALDDFANDRTWNFEFDMEWESSSRFIVKTWQKTSSLEPCTRLQASGLLELPLSGEPWFAACCLHRLLVRLEILRHVEETLQELFSWKLEHKTIRVTEGIMEIWKSNQSFQWPLNKKFDFRS